MTHTHPDPAFPALHRRPARGWVNDPNGCALVDGRYHVFFQYNPEAPRHAAITWGHISSADLVTWQQHPVAIRPRPGALDSFGCWTGCLVVDGEVPTLVYSAVGDDSGRSHVLLARGDTGMDVWRQETVAAVGMPVDETVTAVRDPFLFEVDGRRYAVQGAGSPTGEPQLLVYACDDLSRWDELGALLTTDDPVAARVAPANIWECPNLVPLGDRWVLVLSLWRGDGDGHVLSGVRYLVGDLTIDTHGVPRFSATSGGSLDTGPCFYAPQLLVTAERVLMWGWSWEHHDRPEQDVEAAGWAGALTFCRELRLDGERLVSAPVPELEQLRAEPLEVREHEPFMTPAYELELAAGAGKVTLGLVTDGQEQVIAEWEVPERPAVSPRVLVDGSMVEVFPGTPESFTTRAYPTAGSRWVLRGEAGAVTRAWRLAQDV